MDDNNSKNDPKTLMQLAKNGDAQVFDRLYKLYFRYLHLRVRSRDEKLEKALEKALQLREKGNLFLKF